MSNIGTIGGTYAGPLILPPQVTIVAIGKTARIPRFEN
jgi:2-oxoisovalerate dehydrogenase E2 component (dihydrolipoyl transacylase)